jgi:hypothetical protein
MLSTRSRRSDEDVAASLNRMAMLTNQGKTSTERHGAYEILALAGFTMGLYQNKCFNRGYLSAGLCGRRV